jgi:membrane-bound serine protease (ClpP class)
MLAAFAGVVRADGADRGRPPVVGRVVIRDAIHGVTARYLRRGLATARRARAELLVLQIDTPGGLLSATHTMAQDILASAVPVAVLVAPPGARAASAGAILGVAADVLAMAPGTNIGAAHPVSLPSPVGPSPGGKAKKRGRETDTMDEKVTNDTVARLKAWATRRGRNVELCEKMVRESASYAADDAVAAHLADLIAPDLRSLLRALDGREITRFDGSKRTLRVAGARIVTVRRSAAERLLAVLANPELTVFLLLGGIFGILYELINPGAIFPGILGGLCLLLFFFAAQVMPVRFVGVALVVLAGVFFVLELKVTSYGMLAFAGTIALVLGAAMLVDAPEPSLRPRMTVVLPFAITIAALAGVLVTAAVRAQRRRVQTGIEGLVGMEGAALAPLAPRGKVFARGEYWNARAVLGADDDALPIGTRVKIVGIEGLTLLVEPAAQDRGPQGGSS